MNLNSFKICLLVFSLLISFEVIANSVVFYDSPIELKQLDGLSIEKNINRVSIGKEAIRQIKTYLYNNPNVTDIYLVGNMNQGNLLLGDFKFEIAKGERIGLDFKSSFPYIKSFGLYDITGKEVKNFTYSIGPGTQGSVVSSSSLASIDYSGTNVSGPEWVRPFTDGTCCSGLGPVRYHVQDLFVYSDGIISVSSVQDGWDGYIFVYKDNFDPLNQTANHVAGDDDGNGGIGTSDIENLAVTAGHYIIVTTGFANGDEGTFTNTITGDVGFADVAVPTLSEWGLGILALLLLIYGVIQIRSFQLKKSVLRIG